MKSKLLLVFAILALVSSALLAQRPRLGIIVVSRKGDSEMEAHARQLVVTLRSLRKSVKQDDKDMPILFYHYEDPHQRKLFEDKLQIHDDNLPYVGVVVVNAKDLPTEALRFRVRRSADATNDALTVFNGARSALGLSTVNEVPAEANVKPTPKPVATVQVPLNIPKEITNEKDGSVLELVPAGPFIMGSKRDDPSASADEKPQTTYTLPSYYIGKVPVTNAQYKKFVAETSYKPEGDWAKEVERYGDTLPAVGVTWHDAIAYCDWAGLRLPTEVEWEKAARGTDGRDFPWGTEWDAAKLQCSHEKVKDAGGPAAVGSFPAGASPFGCLDMAGNVCQWCSSLYRLYPYQPDDGREDLQASGLRVLRGESWYINSQRQFRVSFRRGYKPTDFDNTIGFRVAKSP